MMETNGGPESEPGESGSEQGMTDDLRQRLQGSQAEQLAARATARLLARELALSRRLLRVADGNATIPRSSKAAVLPVIQRAVCLTEEIRFHLDTCERQGEHTVFSGWAFRPAPTWDARSASVTILLRSEVAAYAVAAREVPRPDVAAYFAAQGTEAAGGAEGLEAAGFRCDLVNDSLPAGLDLEIVLRLECAGTACEQPTGRRLRL